MKINLFFVLFAIIMTSISQAQNGSIKGTVIDKATNTPLPFVDVLVQGTSIGTTSNGDGKFEIVLTPGSYTIDFSYIGYKTLSESIAIRMNESQTVTVQLAEDSQIIDEVKVTAKVSKETESALLLEQKEAVVISEGIGAVELSKRSVSDVASAVTKITGITKQSETVIVRGLGDRYNAAYYNGLPLPSSDPRKKLIDLEVFKTGIISNISIAKTIQSNYYSDYSGASINVKAKRPPRAFSSEFKIGTGTNFETFGKDFYRQKGGRYDYFGFDDGSRRYPIVFQRSKKDLFTTANINNPPNFFGTSFNTSKWHIPLNFNIGLNAGHTFLFNNGESSFGIFSSVSYSNDYKILEDNTEAIYNSQGEFRDNYDVDQFSFSTNSTGVINAEYKIDNNHRLKWNALAINHSSDELREFFGENPEGDSLFIRRGTFKQELLLVNQLLGSHAFDAFSLDWGGVYNFINNSIPDRKQNTLGYREDIENYSFALSNNDQGQNHRYWQDITENQLAGRFALSYKLNEEEGRKKKIMIGTNIQKKYFDFEANQLNYKIVNPLRISPTPIDNIDGALNLENLRSNQYVVSENPNSSRFVEGELSVYGIYSNAELNFGQFTLVPGIRFEQSNQETFYRLRTIDRVSDPFQVAEIDKSYILPSLSVRYRLNDQMNLRFAGGRSVIRPKFLEIAPFLYEDVTESTIGNPGLENSEITNLDLKYEYFPNDGEVVAVTVFTKFIDNPIEKVNEASSSETRTFINGEKAIATGIEGEIRKNISEKFSGGINASYIFTQSETDPQKRTGRGTNIVITNPEHDLQGASPLIINANLTYKDYIINNVESQLTLDYNYTDRSLYAIGGSIISKTDVDGIGDEFKKGIHSLNFIMRNKINNKLSIDISLKNILNSKNERFIDQKNIEKELTTYRYETGLNLSIGLSYKF